MMRNEPAIRKLKAHLYMIYGLCDDLSGGYGPTCGPLLKHYGEAFNYITIKLLPQMGMTNDEIVDLVTSMGEDNETLERTLGDCFHAINDEEVAA